MISFTCLCTMYALTLLNWREEEEKGGGAVYACFPIRRNVCNGYCYSKDNLRSMEEGCKREFVSKCKKIDVVSFISLIYLDSTLLH